MNKKRTVVCGQKISFDHGVYWIELNVPEWRKNATFAVPITSIPQNVLQRARRFPDNKLRFYAKVNVNASNEKELLIEEFEDLDLCDVFRKNTTQLL